jgi:hypothetical protein
MDASAFDESTLRIQHQVVNVGSQAHSKNLQDQLRKGVDEADRPEFTWLLSCFWFGQESQ